MAVLTVVLVLLSSLGLAMAWAFRGTLVAQQFANNHYQASQAHEAAVAALEEAISWTSSMAATQFYPAPGMQPATCTTMNPFVGACWQNDPLTSPFSRTDLARPPYNAKGYQRLKVDRAGTIDYGAVSSGAGSYATSVRVRHAPDLSAINYLELSARAVSTDSTEVVAVAHAIVYFPFLPARPAQLPRVPLLVNGCVPVSLFSTSNICPQQNDGAGQCSSSTPNGSQVAVGNVAQCGLVAGLLGGVTGTVSNLLSANTLHGGTYQAGVGNGSVFNTMFAGLSLTQLQQASEMQAQAGLVESAQPPRRTLWYFNNIGDGLSHGTADSPAVVVINQTAPLVSLGLGSNYTVNGALYAGNPAAPASLLNINLGGNVTVRGVFGLEGTPSTLGSKTSVIYDDGFYSALSIDARAPTLSAGVATARVPGSWRDW